MVVLMDYECPNCDGHGCNRCDYRGYIRQLTGTIPEDYDDDQDNSA